MLSLAVIAFTVLRMAFSTKFLSVIMHVLEKKMNEDEEQQKGKRRTEKT